MLRTDLVAQLELLAYRIEYEARLPAEQAHAEAIERVDVLVSIQVPQMRALRSLDHDLVGHLLEHRLEAVDHAWVGHVPTVGLRVLLRSEERRVGKECVSTFRSRWLPYH